MKLGTRGKYAVIAMVDLAYYGRPGIPLRLAEISKRQHLPLFYLEQLFSRLKKRNMVESLRGQKGGYVLSKSANQILISDILEAAGESVQATRCSSESHQGCLSDATRCLTHKLWRGLEDQLWLYLKGISLADICTAYQRGESNVWQRGRVTGPELPNSQPSFSIYLDANSSAPLRPKAKQVMMACLEHVGNPASVHQFGRSAHQKLEKARHLLAEAVDAPPHNLIWTSGGTEANYLALCGSQDLCSALLVGTNEHDAVLKNAPDATLIPVNQQGKLDLEFLERHLKVFQPPVLVSVMLAHNETGVLQDLEAISKLVHQHEGWVHTDATQAVGKVPVSFQKLGVDLMSLSAHKLGGPVGIGALIVSDRVPLKGIVKGGGQEQGLRPGTQSVLLTSGFAAAAQDANETLQDVTRNHQLWLANMEQALRQLCPDLWVIGDQSPRLPGVSCLAMPGVSNQLQVMHFDLKGIAISAGAACSSGKVQLSKALLRMGLPEDVVKSAIRISLGWHNTWEDVERFITSWKEIYEAFRPSQPVEIFKKERASSCN